MFLCKTKGDFLGCDLNIFCSKCKEFLTQNDFLNHENILSCQNCSLKFHSLPQDFKARKHDSTNCISRNLLDSMNFPQINPDLKSDLLKNDNINAFNVNKSIKETGQNHQKIFMRMIEF